jgi:uncharacterized protein (DUF1697 family)
VGGHVVKMDRLRALFEEMELQNVQTFIASGNVIFETAHGPAAAGALEARIERGLRAALGYEVATFLRTPAEVAAAAGRKEVGTASADEEGATLYVGFLRAAPPADARDRVLALRTDIDELAVHGRELYWLCRTRISDSPLTGARVEKALGMPTTLRNVTTVRKLAAKYAGA